MNVSDRFMEWLGAVLIALATGIFVALRRWVSMLNKHEQQILLLQQNFTHQQAQNSVMIAALHDVKDSMEQNRAEAASRLDSIKTELRDDINRVINLMRK